jgi:hypothetical protein
MRRVVRNTARGATGGVVLFGWLSKKLLFPFGRPGPKEDVPVTILVFQRTSPLPLADMSPPGMMDQDKTDQRKMCSRRSPKFIWPAQSG